MPLLIQPAAFLLGLLTGAMLLIGVSLVPYWSSLEPLEFSRWFSAHSGLIGRLMVPLGALATVTVVLAVAWQPSAAFLAGIGLPCRRSRHSSSPRSTRSTTRPPTRRSVPARWRRGKSPWNSPGGVPGTGRASSPARWRSWRRSARVPSKRACRMPTSRQVVTRRYEMDSHLGALLLFELAHEGRAISAMERALMPSNQLLERTSEHPDRARRGSRAPRLSKSMGYPQESLV